MASRDSENNILTREQVLALDIVAHTGYFSLHRAGTWNFVESRRHNGNKMHDAFRITLFSLPRRYGIRRIMAGDVSVNRHFYDMRRLSELRGILLEVCDGLDIPEPEFVNPAVLKRWATGDRRAIETQVTAVCKDRHGIAPVNDNTADACHLSYYCIRRHKL